MVLLFCVCYSDIIHWYHSKEKDWGYGHFIAMQVMTINIKPLTEYYLLL